MLHGLRPALAVLSLILFFSLAAGGCGKHQLLPPADGEAFKVALLVEGTIYDQGWDSQAFEGLRKIERSLHAKINYHEFHNQVSEEKIEEKAREFAEGGYDLIFGHGRVFQQAFNKLGPEFPEASFVFFNEEPAGKNVHAIFYTPESMGFFAGMTAGLMTRTQVVGIIPAYLDQKEVDGFLAGVQYVNPGAKVLAEEVGSWGDREKGREIALRMISRRADVLFGAGDAYNIEVITSARERGVYAIGFITDQSKIARETVLVSVLQDVANVYLEIAEKAQKGELAEDRYVFDFTNGGQDLSPFGEMVPKPTQERILQALEQYKKGELFIPEKGGKRKP